MARLVAISDASKAFRPTIDVPDAGIMLGRSVEGPGSVLLPGGWRQVSSRHCRLYLDQGNWVVESLGRNPCYVSGAKIMKGESKTLFGGEEIKISIGGNLSDPALINWTFMPDSSRPASPDRNGGAAKGAVPKSVSVSPTGVERAAAGSGSAKRKAGATPPSFKRSRVSDGSSWALEQNAKLRQQLQEQHEAHQEELSLLEEQVAKVEAKAAAEASSARHALAAQQKQLESALLQVEEMEGSRHAAADAQVQERDSRIDGLEKALEAAEIARGQLQEELATGASQLALLQGEAQAWKEREAKLLAQHNQTLQVAEERASKIAALTSELGASKVKAEEAARLLRASERQQQYLQNDIEAKEYQLGDMQAALEQLRVASEEVYGLTAEEAAARAALAAAFERRQHAEELRRERETELRRLMAFLTGGNPLDDATQVQEGCEDEDMRPMEAPAAVGSQEPTQAPESELRQSHARTPAPEMQPTLPASKPAYSEEGDSQAGSPGRRGALGSPPVIAPDSAVTEPGYAKQQRLHRTEPGALSHTGQPGVRGDQLQGNGQSCSPSPKENCPPSPVDSQTPAGARLSASKSFLGSKARSSTGLSTAAPPDQQHSAKAASQAREMLSQQSLGGPAAFSEAQNS